VTLDLEALARRLGVAMTAPAATAPSATAAPPPTAAPTAALASIPPEAWPVIHAMQSFPAFVRQAWPIVEPARALLPGWHLDVIAEHLEAFARGEIRRLIINQPPGTAKSIMGAVMLPAWIWTWRPEWRGLFASYSDTLARRDSLRTRNLVTSPWYRQAFGIELVEDRQDDFANQHTGRRMATSVSGRSTGFRANAVIVDDPISATEAYSEAARESAIRWYTQALPSRVDDPDRAGFLVVMQRLHERDLSGYLLAAELGYEHLCLPAEHDPRRSTVTTIAPEGYDRRSEEGALLCPALHSREFIDEAKKTLGSYGFSGQYNQSPAPLEGGAVKVAWWRFFREPGAPPIQPRPHGAWGGEAVELPELDEVIISVDLSVKGEARHDHTAIVVIGRRGADRFVLDLVARPMEFVEQIKAIQAIQAKWPRARRTLVEDSANWAALTSTMGSEIAGLIPVKAQGSKESRVIAASATIESGNTYLRDGAPWVDMLIGQGQMFPRGRRDDAIDALAQGILDGAASADYRVMLTAFGPESPGPTAKPPAPPRPGIFGLGQRPLARRRRWRR
jgi:predicted phage terminase large subunit-like protein